MGGNISSRKNLHKHHRNCERHNEQRIDSYCSDKSSLGNEDIFNKSIPIIPQLTTKIYYEENCENSIRKLTEEEIRILKLAKQRSFDLDSPLQDIQEEPEFELKYRSNIKF